jgi:26S proteasome regulatory subunit T5
MFIGDGAKLVRDAFELAKTHKAAIIFIDELDAIGTKRFDSDKSGDREVQRTMLELLNQLDGFGSDDRIKVRTPFSHAFSDRGHKNSRRRAPVQVIAATNRIDVLDPALLRSGRLDRKIEFPLPNEDARAKIMEIHSRKMRVSKKVNFEELARSTDEFNGAQLKVRPRTEFLCSALKFLVSELTRQLEWQAVCVEAGMIALREGFTEINHEHYLSGILEVQSKKKNDHFYFA